MGKKSRRNKKDKQKKDRTTAAAAAAAETAAAVEEDATAPAPTEAAPAATVAKREEEDERTGEKDEPQKTVATTEVIEETATAAPPPTSDHQISSEEQQQQNEEFEHKEEKVGGGAVTAATRTAIDFTKEKFTEEEEDVSGCFYTVPKNSPSRTKDTMPTTANTPTPTAAAAAPLSQASRRLSDVSDMTPTPEYGGPLAVPSTTTNSNHQNVTNNNHNHINTSHPHSGTSSTDEVTPHNKKGTTDATGTLFIPAAVNFAEDNTTLLVDTNGLDDDSFQNNMSTSRHDGRIVLGICAMDKKARSKPMAEILSRLDETLFKVVFFGDEVILNKPIEDWPSKIDVLIAFYSKGYPLEKAKEYVALRNPLLINDLEMQSKLQDRRCVYDLLEASGIDVPRHVFLSNDGYVSTGTGDGNKLGETTVQEFDDHIEINGVSVHKPFVEKPVDADDHNIAIYYPSSAGGGCKKLFRKIGNRSSEFYPDIHEIRRDGSYLYEEFVETQGTDVKMYTVGPDYGHAEARKSPCVDGKVQRNSDGKEMRFPVILTMSEKEIARRIVIQFKQFVCGFDLLRVQEGHGGVVSYCCDVNGFSFVKHSRKYYDDCAQILTEHMLAMMKPGQLLGFSTLDPLVTEVDNMVSMTTITDPSSSMNPLHHVANMFRNNNNNCTPTGSEANSIDVADTRSLGNLSIDHILNDDPTLLEEGAVPVREIPRELISEPASLPVSRDPSFSNLLEHHNSNDSGERSSTTINSISGRNSRGNISMHQEELRCVIAVVRHGDRTPKQKLKVNTKEPIILQYFVDHSANESECTKDLKIKAKKPMVDFLEAVRAIISKYEAKLDNNGNMAGDAEETKDNKKLLSKFHYMRNVLERWKFTGLTRKLQIKPRKFDTDPDTGEKLRCKEVQLILKWGGDLTKLGENQAIKLGKQFRQEIYPDAPGGGILRLHSTFRHDLKIKTSDEGRVMKTAASFAKGLLELEGEITPILVSLVHKEKGSFHMLDPSGDKDVKLELDECKEQLSKNLQQDIDWRAMTEEDKEKLVGPPQITSLRDSLAKIGNPRETLRNIYQLMGQLIEKLEEMLSVDENSNNQSDDDADAGLSGVKLYKGETLLELTERWRFIYSRLYDDETDTFDLTRIPDVLDNVRFDVLHNPHLGLTKTLHRLYSEAKDMADTVVPQEYGTTISQKRNVGIKICSSLLDKIRHDLQIARTDNKTDMRYMINMDYSADLPINTMGRRIRTRLYFTSESHLHTLVNVLRFAAGDDCCDGCFTSPVLSPNGMELLNDSKEVCYLTHFVIRLFEDVSRKITDDRRFRVEILFSAGATATPIHQANSVKGVDLTRIDTEPLVSVGREGLTCAEVERFLDCVIAEGGKCDDYDVGSTTSSLADMMKKKTSTPTNSDSNTKRTGITNATAATESIESSHRFSVDSNATIRTRNVSTSKTIDRTRPIDDLFPVHVTIDENVPGETLNETQDDGISDNNMDDENTNRTKDDGGNDIDEEDDNNKDKSRYISHKYFYLTVATGTLLLGAGCLMMAMGLTKGRFSRRRYSVRR